MKTTRIFLFASPLLLLIPPLSPASSPTCKLIFGGTFSVLHVLIWRRSSHENHAHFSVRVAAVAADPAARPGERQSRLDPVRLLLFSDRAALPVEPHHGRPLLQLRAADRGRRVYLGRLFVLLPFHHTAGARLPLAQVQLHRRRRAPDDGGPC